MKVKVEAIVKYTATKKFTIECDVDAAPEDIKQFTTFDKIYDQIDVDDLDYNDGEQITMLEPELGLVTVVSYKDEKQN